MTNYISEAGWRAYHHHLLRINAAQSLKYSIGNGKRNVGKRSFRSEKFEVKFCGVITRVLKNILAPILLESVMICLSIVSRSGDLWS